MVMPRKSTLPCATGFQAAIMRQYPGKAPVTRYNALLGSISLQGEQSW